MFAVDRVKGEGERYRGIGLSSRQMRRKRIVLAAMTVWVTNCISG
jgi:hypothetical protein